LQYLTSAISVQLVPFHCSTFVYETVPGPLFLLKLAKAAVCIPNSNNYSLPVFKSLTSVQLVPFQDSVLVTVVVGDLTKSYNAAAVDDPLAPEL
jgi:hypothetical protein